MASERLGYGSAESERPTQLWVDANGQPVIGPLPTTHNMHYAHINPAGALAFFRTRAHHPEPALRPVAGTEMEPWSKADTIGALIARLGSAFRGLWTNFEMADDGTISQGWAVTVGVRRGKLGGQMVECEYQTSPYAALLAALRIVAVAECEACDGTGHDTSVKHDGPEKYPCRACQPVDNTPSTDRPPESEGA